MPSYYFYLDSQTEKNCFSGLILFYHQRSLVCRLKFGYKNMNFVYFPNNTIRIYFLIVNKLFLKKKKSVFLFFSDSTVNQAATPCNS